MINVIGIGQNRENMTLGALKAIEESDVVIGYKKYINQIEDLIQDKEVIKKGMGDEMDALRDSSLDHKDRFVDEIDGIVNKFDKIMNLLMDEVDALVNRSEDGSVFVDVSEEDLERTKQGKIALSCNYAVVEGDRNVGGIVGSMAIEYSADPEDDLEKPSTLNFTYNTKAVLQQCRNEGGVNAKKDYVGGIVGNMSLGTVYECESYAEI